MRLIISILLLIQSAIGHANSINDISPSAPTTFQDVSIQFQATFPSSPAHLDNVSVTVSGQYIDIVADVSVADFSVGYAVSGTAIVALPLAGNYTVRLFVATRSWGSNGAYSAPSLAATKPLAVSAADITASVPVNEPLALAGLSLILLLVFGIARPRVGM